MNTHTYTYFCSIAHTARLPDHNLQQMQTAELITYLQSDTLRPHKPPRAEK